MKNKWLTVLFFIIIVSVFSGWTFTNALGEHITACLKKDGTIHIVTNGVTCSDKESLLVWNIAGVKGDKGDKGDVGEKGPIGLTGLHGERGEVGLPGIQGERGPKVQNSAGNIAFIYSDYLLRSDGTVWIAGANPGNIPPYTQVGVNYSGVTNVPIPVEDIIVWQYSKLLDKDGNYWYISQGNVQAGWHNFGPLP